MFNDQERESIVLFIKIVALYAVTLSAVMLVID